MRRETLAIPIRCTEYSNTSQVVALYTEEVGLLEGIAKGAHRPKSSFQGPFDLAVLYRAVFFDRATGLSTLVESTVEDGFRGLRSSWARYRGCLHVLEFIRLVATYGTGEAALFRHMVDVLHRLEAGHESLIPAVLARFDLRALRLLGLLPPLAECLGCGRVWPRTDGDVYFSFDAGGLLCRACRQRRAQLRASCVPGRAVRFMDRMAESTSIVFDPEVCNDWQSHERFLCRAVKDLRTRLLERELTSEQLGLRRSRRTRPWRRARVNT